MVSGWRYRLASVTGAIAITLLAVGTADLRSVQELLILWPVLDRLPVTGAETRSELMIEVGAALVIVLAALVPLFKPRPRRILDTISLTQKRVMIAVFVLAAIGYFDYTYRLPRVTLIVSGAVLLLALPAWFVTIRHRPHAGGEHAIIIGDDPGAMAAILDVVDMPIIGYVSPPSRYEVGNVPDAKALEFTDGGELTERAPLDELDFLGGFSRLDDVLVEYDIDTAVLAFARPDREEFFGALDTCYEHGVTAKVHREHADSVLTNGIDESELVEVDLEPWDWQDYMIKRMFDVAFASVGLIVLMPVVGMIALAIKLDDGGPLLYSQKRTAAFGDTFTVYKFRSMVPDAESKSGVKLSEEDAGGIDPRVTRIGWILRQTHLDEIPQLWSVLVGDMSVVGPRPERPELDTDMEATTGRWRSRWFVKPGLTGLAQINQATGYDPEEKLRYDVEYIRRQSFWFDLKIVIRQVWDVFQDVLKFI